MKFVFILGGTTGFTIAASTGWYAGRTADRILVDGMIGCMVGAVLFRWFWNVLLKGVQDTYIARHRAALSAVPVPVAIAKTKI